MQRLLHEIHDAMEKIWKLGRMSRLRSLRRSENDLSYFASRLDAAAQAFTVRMS
jgi:hypothetical protein